MRRITALLGTALAVVALVAASATAGAVTDDPHRPAQWGLDRIGAEAAWAATDGTGAVVAVVDTGVDLGHPDLQGKLVSAGADFVEPNQGDGAQDENGHGTHVAGVIGAVTGNGTGVAGVAPGARILPVRVLDHEGSGTSDHIARGIRYATSNGADVVNLSLGFVSGVDQVAKVIGALDPIYDAIDEAVAHGVVVVVAAGNDSVPLCAEPSGHPDVLCVGATDRNDLRSYYSNGDATGSAHYVVAPGGDGITCAGGIVSTYLRTADHVCGYGTGYESTAGTSTAAPHAAGVAALVTSATSLTGLEVVRRITSTARDLGTPGRDPVYGHGIVDARAAVGA